MEILLQMLGAIKKLSPALEKYLKENVVYKKIKKKDWLLQEGKICKEVFFIERGLVYSSYNIESKQNIQNVCNWIYTSGDVVFSVYSFYQQKPAYENICCLEDTSAFCLSYEKLMYVYDTFSEFNFIGRLLTQKYYLECELRLYGIRKISAEKRYENFLEKMGPLAHTIPLNIVADFLSINKATLSRIRNQLSKEK